MKVRHYSRVRRPDSIKTWISGRHDQIIAIKSAGHHSEYVNQLNELNIHRVMIGIGMKGQGVEPITSRSIRDRH